MPKTDYPTAADLKNLILSIGIIDDLSEDPVARIPWDTHLLAARQSVEGESGRRFKALQQTRKFDTPESGKILVIGADIAEITEMKVNGTVLTEDTDYFGLPENAPDEGKPYNLIELQFMPFRGRRNIEVTGLWGYSELVPDLAWDAILADAAIRCIPALETSISNGMKSIKLGQDSYTFGDEGAFSVAGTNWKTQRDAAVTFYKRAASMF